MSNPEAPACMDDMHCHLDWVSNAEALCKDAASGQTALFCNVVLPSTYASAVERFSRFENVRVGLGFHPWYVKDDFEAQLEILQREFSHTSTSNGTVFLGEVGMDFGKRCDGTEEQQETVFGKITDLAATRGDCVLSIHSIRSADRVLDILESKRVLDSCTCIMHWFSGSVEQLHRAIRLGCFFSVNPMMATSRRGREYLKVIPIKRMLLETDGPPGEGVDYPYAQLSADLGEALQVISEIKGPDAASRISTNSRSILGL